MLRETDAFDAQGFAFADPSALKAPLLVKVEHGAHGAAATIDDAHLLFNSDFSRSGNDLHLNGHDGERAIVRDYFGAEPAALMSRDGARLAPDLVEALTRSTAPHQYAQATPPAPAAGDAVGRVVTASPDSTILRNGVPVTVAPGDPVLRADVLQTAAGTMAVTFNDGSTLNLTANTRIVVSEFIYSPSNTGNSQLLDLVQGSLTFISGEVAHTGNMSIGTPVATMGIRGTVGGVTTASDGTVQFYVSQSATGAVIINQQGQIIANVVQDGPLIVVRPVGPLQVIADEVQKSPAQLAVELQALQQIVNIKAVGDQLLQQFFQPQQPNPNPQAPGGPHTQIQADDKLKITLFTEETAGGNGAPPPAIHALIEHGANDPGAPPIHVAVPIPVNLPPVTFAPLSLTTAEDTPIIFGGGRAISVVDNDSATLTVTLSVTNGVLALGSIAGLTFIAGGTGHAAMIFSGSPAAIAAALQGLTYTPAQDYNGPATLSIVAGDGNSTPLTTKVTLNVTPVNDAPVLGDAANAPVAYTENDCPTVVNPTLTVSDVDSAKLFGATVKIAANFACGEDVLSFTSQFGITGTYDAHTGVLTLSGEATLAEYQTVLRSVTYENTSDHPSDLPRTIEFQVDDGSSQHSASNVVSTVVEVTPVNTPPVLDFFNINLHSDGSPVVLTPDDISVTDPDGPSIIFTVTHVTGGSFVVAPGDNNQFFSTVDNEGCLSFTSEDIAAGRVSFVPDGSGDPASYRISVSDGIDSSTPVTDHLPIAQNTWMGVVAGTAVTCNLVIILDTSSSMDGQRLADAKAAIQHLLDAQGVTINGVMAASFAEDGVVHGANANPWVSASEASDYFAALQASGGTNYENAINSVMSAWRGSHPPDADNTLVYFISDGEPNGGDMAGLQGEWKEFLSHHEVDTAYAIGISPDVSATHLEPIAWSSDNSDFPPTNLQSTSDLGDTLAATVTEFHNIFADGNVCYGVDGGRIESVTVDGVTYRWDGTTISSDSECSLNASGGTLTVETPLGGTLTFHFATENGHDAGDWSYVPPDYVEYSIPDGFGFTLVDSDGDRASAFVNLVVVPEDGPNVLDDAVFTNASTFDLPSWALLRNDTDPEWLLKVTEADTSGNPEAVMSVALEDGKIAVNMNCAESDSFVYVATDEANQSTPGTVTVTKVNDLDLSGRDQISIIVADDSGVTMKGGLAADVLVGGGGNDTMTGNNGSDHFVFKPGGGADTVTDFSGYENGGQRDIIVLEGFGVADFEQLQALMSDVGSGCEHTTLIDFGNGNSITLEHVDRTQLHAWDFIFHPQSTNLV